MLQSNIVNGEENPSFKWGAKKEVGRKDNRVCYYESFSYEGIEYRLFDSAYFFVNGQCETSIGKLVNMYETALGEKKVKVIWFFRPIDIHRFLGEYEPRWNELFLACGDEKGVSNINDAEAILGKCNVVYTSTDGRNPRPEGNELRTANYFFSRTFNTGLKVISEEFADAIAGIKVEKLFNRTRDKQPVKRPNSSAAARSRTSPVKSFHSNWRSKVSRDAKITIKTSTLKKEDHADHVDLRKNRPVDTDTTSSGPIAKTRTVGDLHTLGSSVDSKPSKRRKLILNTPETGYSGSESGEKKFIKDPPRMEKAPNMNFKQSSWYKKLPFEEELKGAIEKNRVLLIENLEPSYTSMEVEDLCWLAFNERVDAKMIPSSLMSSPYNGRALVIFGTTKAADSAMSRLAEKCLMISDQRPLLGSREIPVEVGKCNSFTGHFGMLDRSLMQTLKRNAVSTSHCAQPNHVVYPMGCEWLAQQAKSQLMWEKLFEAHAKEIDILKSKYHHRAK